MVANHFHCPVCHYQGEFTAFRKRMHAQCPQCKCLERHRLQFVIFNKLIEQLPTKNMSILHCAPDPFFAEILKSNFGIYESADIAMSGVDHQVDLQSLPFENNRYDIVFASHVLEHIRDDLTALKEISRILKPGGFAILPVPIVGEKTYEYEQPEPSEDYHVRAPGLDYYQRYKQYFSKIKYYCSKEIPAENQAYVYCDSNYSHPMKYSECQIFDLVPVCYK